MRIYKFLPLLLVAALLMGCANQAAPATTAPTTEAVTQPTTQPTTVATQPPVEKIATATVSSTGDLLFHNRVIESGYNKETGEYNYDSIYTYFKDYVQKADYAVANCEGSLCGLDNGFKYSGYPGFNTPDASVDAAKNAGFDMLLTANNHTYDTGTKGFHRTQEVIADRGLDYIGTRPNEEAKTYLVKDMNGIKVGMVCYTYETQKVSDTRKSLNGIAMSSKDSPLISSFHHRYLEEFYAQLASELEAMKAEGADITMVYIHWGEEYITKPNSLQKKIAQQLCDMGVDVIVGGHPHVIQPIELLTSGVDPSHATVCLYSMGNAVSNIRKSTTKPHEVEDGMLFDVTFAKYSDGSVIVESIHVLPTWVNRRENPDSFPIIPLDTGVKDWQAAFDLTEETLALAQASLARTEKIIQEGLDAANSFYSQRQADHEAAIGVTE